MAMPPAPRPAPTLFDGLNFLNILNGHSLLFTEPSYSGIVDLSSGTTYNSLKEITQSYMNSIRSIGSINTGLGNLTTKVNGYVPGLDYLKTNLSSFQGIVGMKPNLDFLNGNISYLKNLVAQYGSIDAMLKDWANLPTKIQAAVASAIGSYTNPLQAAISGAGGLNDRVNALKAAFTQWGRVPTVMGTRFTAVGTAMTSAVTRMGRTVSTANANVDNTLFKIPHSISLWKVQGLPPSRSDRTISGNGALGYIGQILANADFWITQPDAGKAALEEVGRYFNIVVGPAIRDYPLDIANGITINLGLMRDDIMTQMNGLRQDLINIYNDSSARFACASKWTESPCRSYV